MITILFLFCLILASAATNGTIFSMEADNYMQGSILEILEAESSVHCAVFCNSDAECGSANYDTSSRECELLAVEAGPVAVETKEGMVHICCNCEGAAENETVGKQTIVNYIQ